MYGQRIPDLEKMDEQQAQHFLTELFSDLSAEVEYEIHHEDYVMEMPQSEERIRGPEKMREFQEAYPAPPTIQLRRVAVREGLWVLEGVNDYRAKDGIYRRGQRWEDVARHPLLRRAVRGARVAYAVGRRP